MASNLIIHPTDFSNHSAAALEFASQLATQTGGELMIVHVAPPAGYPPGASAGADLGTAAMAGVPVSEAEMAERDAILQERLREIQPAAENVPHQHMLLTGEPAEEIVRLAGDLNASQIVVGSHGRKGVSRLLMGSVAEWVVRDAPCPVTIVKLPEHSDRER